MSQFINFELKLYSGLVCIVWFSYQDLASCANHLIKKRTACQKAIRDIQIFCTFIPGFYTLLVAYK